MPKTHVVQRRIKHHGKFLNPGDKVDASGWPTLRSLLNSGTLVAKGSATAPSSKASKSQKKKSKKNTKAKTEELLPADVGGLNEEELMKLKKADLVDLAIENGRPHSGTKADIVSRLV